MSKIILKMYFAIQFTLGTNVEVTFNTFCLELLKIILCSFVELIERLNKPF